MRKLICVALVLIVFIGGLTACNFTKKVSGAIAGEAEATPKVEEVMIALSEDRISDVKSLMHPQISESLNDSSITQLGNYLAGRKVSSMEINDISINSSTSISGNSREEKISYKVTLDDTEVIYLSVFYLSNSEGVGFVSFQMVLGVV